MKINDTRTNQTGVKWSDMAQGCVYTYSCTEPYILYTDENTVVNLEDGVVWHENDFDEAVSFTLVNAKLEIS